MASSYLRFFIVVAGLILIRHTISSAQDSVMISKIFTYCLEQGKSYERLRFLSESIGNRLSGSANADKAVQWGLQTMQADSFADCWLQDVMVPHWVRNDKESLVMLSKGKKTPLNIFSLGGSVATPKGGIKAGVVEVASFDELEKLGRANIEGKIVFFNVPMKERFYHTFEAYGDAGKYRWAGAQNAAKYGAVASITRSLTLALDDNPHTGGMGYLDGVPKIPGCAISTLGADRLSSELKSNPELQLVLEMNCETLPDKLSHNVIAEIRGTEFPDEIIVVCGHLDSWDKGHGAHDDGAGCVQSMELLNLFRDLKIQPKRTIRVILYMNEENGVRGGKKYAEEAREKGEKHIAAIESDAGAFTPAGFSSTCIDDSKRVWFRQWKPLFKPYAIFQWDGEGGGVDIGPLKDQGTLLIGLRPDSQRYFDYHHTDIDTFDKVNRRELHLGAAAIISMAWLLSEYGAGPTSSK
ncbi:MAG: M20/M25/M40 family metallo-hydrolase [Bacteroidota bacterium]